MMIIIYNDSYPFGRACTNRIHYYAKGLKENKNRVKILIHRPTEPFGKKTLNRQIKGFYQDVPFEYTAKRTVRSESFIERRIHDLKGILNAGSYIIKNRNSISSLLLVSNSLLQILYYKLITKFFDITFIQEKSEIPFLYRKKTLPLRIYKWFYINTVYKLFDGIIVISNNLKSFLSDKINKKTKLLLLPILIDSSEFSKVVNYKQNKTFRIAYAGSLCQKKDGALDLIKAFGKIIEKKYKAELLIVGDTQNKNDKQKIYSLINDLHLQKHVTLTGYLPRNEYLNTLSSADLLAFAKPLSNEAEYCFPSKLGEFMMTGKPVLTTRAGIIPQYINDSQNGFLADAGNPDNFATKIENIINNYPNAVEAGKCGVGTAFLNFDYKENSKKINEFIIQLNSSKHSLKHKNKSLSLANE